uniref:Uncharacterized protein n=1 Tax=Dulem virus 36 TaxID=3145754 RepID=A0AAU8B0E1_9CAUD
MGKKGIRPANYETCIAPNRHPHPPFTEEERKKGPEAMKRKKREKMFLQMCMRDLLDKKVINANQREALKNMGFDTEDLTNQTLLMVALFRKGITGDVQAIGKIIDMMDKLDLYKETKTLTQAGVTINLVQHGDTYKPSPQEQLRIMQVENGEFDDTDINKEWDTDADDNWGNEIYNP